MDAKHMLDGWKWFPALGIAGGAILAGVFAGMALAAFATGGLQDRLLQHEPQSITAFLGNPNAREADLMASAEDEHSPPGYAVYCKGCGPGLKESSSEGGRGGKARVGRVKC